MLSFVCDAEVRYKVSLRFVLQVGDFEPHRHDADLRTMDCPSKYRKLGDFPDFFAGHQEFPWPIYFIGGNHEPYGYLDKYPEGGELIANCRYLGRAETLELEGLRVAGLTGIYSPEFFTQSRPTLQDFGKLSLRRWTYFHEDDVDRLLAQNEGQAVDVLILHDWPAHLIAHEGLPRFAFLDSGLKSTNIGNEISEFVMRSLQPRLVLCGHMHTSYRRHLALKNARTIDVCCLGSYHNAREAIAIFHVDEDGSIQEVVATTKP